MPAGARLKYRSNVPKYSEFVFEPLDTAFPKRAMEAKKAGKHTVIVAGESYGQGSSREHAALCPMYLGVKAIVAKSVERIHAANLVNFGIVSLAFKDMGDYDRIEQGDEIEIPDIKKKLQNNEPVILKNRTKNIDIELTYSLSQRQKDILFEGGLLSYTVK
jgi:aconitate hydratase